MKYIFPLLFLLILFNTKAQLNDNMWIVVNADNLFHVDFRENPPYISQKPKHLDYTRAQSVFCDDGGDLLYYTNSFQINNKMDSLLENGDSLNIGHYYDIGNDPVQNGSFFLPAPGDSTHCYYIYMYPEYFPGVFPLPIKLQYALIDKTANNGLGRVIEKNVPVLSGGLELNFNHASAVRHANGRDWWIIAPTRMESKYYRVLLTPDGFSAPGVQVIGFKAPTTDPNKYFGYNKFSPDGAKYADFDIRNAMLQFFDFDRCTGLFSNPTLFQMIDSPMDPLLELGYSSISFSPSGKRFYFSYSNLSATQLVQFNMEAADFLSSKYVLMECQVGTSIFDCSLARAVLAPNGKIYVGAVIDTVAYHVINKPDNLGAACDFEFGGFAFPAILPKTELSDFPNYRLGPIDGSPCDTLGIDNIPVASFYWDATELAVGFSNVSYHEPDSFAWDFGDGGTSTETNPLHNFPAPGSYNVCLTASNANGSNTVCKLVEVDTLTIIPVAAFTWDAVELDVTFTNNSYNAPESYLWDFGDTNTSTEANPLHSYAMPGSYNVCLTASNSDGDSTSCEIVAVDTIVAPIIPVAAFNWDAEELEVTFTNLSYNAPEDFLWDFGDTGTSTAANPVHNYAVPGSYNVCLFASNANGSDTLCQVVAVDTLLDSTSLVLQTTLYPSVTVHPNPTNGKVRLDFAVPLSADTVWSLNDLLGRKIHQFHILAGRLSQTVSLEDLPDGLYFWTLTEEQKLIGSGKLIIIQ